MAREKIGKTIIKQANSLPPADFKAWVQKNIHSVVFAALEKLISFGNKVNFFDNRAPTIEIATAFYQQAMLSGVMELLGFDSESAFTDLIVVLGKINMADTVVTHSKETKAANNEMNKFQPVAELAKLADELHVLANRKATSSEVFANKLTAARFISTDICTQPTAEGNTLLHLTARNGDIDKTLALLIHSTPFDPSAKNAQGQTPADLWPQRPSSNVDLQALSKSLLSQGSNAWQPFFEILVKAPALVHVKDSLGRTPLHQAAIEKNSFKIQALRMFGADVTARDGQGKTPFDLLPNDAYPALKENLQITPAKPAESLTTVPPTPTSQFSTPALETKRTKVPSTPTLEAKETKWTLPKTFRAYADQLAPCEREIEPYLSKLQNRDWHSTTMLAYEKQNIASLLLLFKNKIQPVFASSPRGETLHIVSFGAGGMDELIPLLVLAKAQGIKIHLWAFDKDPEMVESAKKRYDHPDFKEHFTYLCCDASKPQIVKKAIEDANGKFKGAPLTLILQPDVHGKQANPLELGKADNPEEKEDPKTRAAFHVITTETTPLVSATDSVTFCCWYWQSEANTTTASMSQILGVYTTTTPPETVRLEPPHFTVNGILQEVPHRFAAIYRCKGRAFERGKELRNLCLDHVTYDQFKPRLEEILRIDPSLVSEPDANPEIRDTALHHAARKGNIAKMRLLLEYRADINARNKQDLTPFDVLKKGENYPDDLLKCLQPAAKPAVTANPLSHPHPSNNAATVAAATKQGFLPTKTIVSFNEDDLIPGYQIDENAGVGRHKY